MPGPLNLPWPGPGPILRPFPSRGDFPNYVPRHGWLQINLVRRPRSIGTKVSYKLFPPATLVAVQPPLVTGPLGALTFPPRPKPVRYRLSPPTVVSPLPVVTTVSVSLAYQSRGGAHYRLSAPATLVPPPNPPVVTTLLRSLADQRLRVRTISTLGAPAVVSPAPPVVTTLRVKLVPSPRQGRQSGYGLAPPAIVDLPPAPPLRVSLAQQKLTRHKIISRLGVPTVLGTVTGAAPVAPIRVRLAVWRRPRPTIHQLRAGLTATPTHDCRKPLLTDSSGAFGSLVEAGATRGSLGLSAGTAGTLTDSGGTHGTLTESASTKGDLDDTC